MKNKNQFPEKESATRDSHKTNPRVTGKVSEMNDSGNSSPAQRSRLINWLRKRGHIDTVEARRELDILSPASRIMELRKGDFKIETVWIDRETDAGKKHRIGRYVLVSSPKASAA